MSIFQTCLDLIRGKKRLALVDAPIWEYKKLMRNYERIKQVIRERKSEVIRVGFVNISNLTVNPFLLYLYRKFSEDARFEPYMVVAPYAHLSSAYMKETTRRMVDQLEREGCRVISGYDFAEGVMTDIQGLFADGLLFFTDPYDYLTDKHFIFENFVRTSLTYYIPYSYCIAGIDNCARMAPQKRGYKVFVETRLHLDMVKKHSPIKGANLADFVGYLGAQRFLEKKELHYEWKCPTPGMKKVILAPHHLLGCGNFLRFYRTYLELAEKYRDQISFVMKPHPVLRETLREHWSAEQIEAYFAEWDRMPNTRLEQGDYEALFFSSDAMILDSISFCAEYTLLDKPMLFIEKLKPHRFNPVGQKLLRQHYRGNSEQAMVDFLERVVLGGEDEMREKRRRFAAKYLIPENKDVASNIYDYVVRDLGIDEQHS